MFSLMGKYLLIAFLVSLIVSVQAHGQSRTLDYYLTQAIDNSPDLTENRNIVDSARLQKDIIKSDLNLPLVTATGDYLYAPFSNYWGYDEAITDGGHYSTLLNVDYPILTNKKRKVRLKSTSVSIKKSDYQIEQIIHELKRTVTDQYITTYQDLMRLQYLEKIHKLLNAQKNILQSLAQQGVSHITDVKQLDIELQDNRIAQNQAKNTYQQDLLQLNATCGLPDSSHAIQLQKPAIFVDSSLVKNSRFMQQFTLDSVDVATQQQVSELKYQPDITLYGNSGLNAVKFTGVENHFGYSVGLHVSLPIYNGNQKSLTRQQSQLQQHSIDAYQQQFKKTRNLFLYGLQNQLEQKQEQLNMIRQQILQYQDLLIDYQKVLGQGVISIVDYLTILKNYTDAEQQEIQTLGEQLKLKNELNYWNW